MGRSEDQLQPEDSLVDRGVADILDEGFSPPDHPRSTAAIGVTAEEQREGETFAERERQLEPDVFEGIDDDDESNPDDWSSDVEAGKTRAGRLLAPDEGWAADVDAEMIAFDEGIDGAGASAEEAAMHVIDPDDQF